MGLIKLRKLLLLFLLLPLNLIVHLLLDFLLLDEFIQEIIQFLLTLFGDLLFLYFFNIWMNNLHNLCVFNFIHFQTVDHLVYLSVFFKFSLVEKMRGWLLVVEMSVNWFLFHHLRLSVIMMRFKSRNLWHGYLIES